MPPEADRDLALVGAAHDRQLERSACTRRVERLVQRVDSVHSLTARGDDQVASLEAGALGGAVALDRADQQAVALGQPDRAAQTSGDARRRDRDAEPDRLRSLASAERVDSLTDRAVGGEREDQSRVDAHRVDPEQPALDVDERTAGRAARERRGVLDRP